MFSDREGILEFFGGTTSPPSFELMLLEVRAGETELIPVPHGQLLAAVDLACECTWRAGRIVPAPFVAWRPLIEAGRGEYSPPVLLVPPDKRDELFADCYKLLVQEEFFSWQFEEAEQLIERYLDMRGRDSMPTADALLALLQEGVRAIVDDQARSLIRSRLLRMAPLLHELYEEEEAWQWAIVAADALADDSSIPPEEHPLLLGMVACGLENALDEEIYWLDLF